MARHRTSALLLALVVVAGAALVADAQRTRAAAAPPKKPLPPTAKPPTPPPASGSRGAAPTNVCASPCLNGGKCNKGRCQCRPGTSGATCTLNAGYFVDAKTKTIRPCLPGGWCVDGVFTACPAGSQTQGSKKTQLSDCKLKAGYYCSTDGSATTACTVSVCLAANYCVGGASVTSAAGTGTQACNCDAPKTGCPASPAGSTSALACTCPLCADGKACDLDADCLFGYCASGVCATPTCSDQVQNGGEAGVDCGGPCSLGCNGDSCDANADCKSNYCAGTCMDDPCDANPCGVNSSSCTPVGAGFTCTCSGDWRGTVCDTDCSATCGGAVCDKCADGDAKTCTGDDGCLSGYCDAGVCKDDPCLPDPCNGNGSCTRAGVGFTCTCNNGFGGAMCATDCSTTCGAGVANECPQCSDGEAKTCTGNDGCLSDFCDGGVCAEAPI
jgi:hypothetical protein